VGGQSRNRIARLLNDPATQSLTIQGTSRIQWLRGGSSPEAQHVTFESSTDGGVNYTFLGNGTRITGGWELTGQSLPASGQIRARARTTGGYSNGSSGLVEAVAAFPPETITGTSNDPLTLNNKELKATGAATRSGSTTLSGSVTVSGGPVTFSGPVTLNGNTAVSVTDTVTITGPLTSNPPGGTLVKSGPGTLVLDGANFSGTIVLTEGTVIVKGPNGNTCFTVGGSATLAGTGNINCVVLAPGSRISPGTSPGTLALLDTEWPRQGTYDWEINHATGTAGANPGWDLLDITGPLNLTATGVEPFTIRLETLTLADEPGSMVNFNNNTAYSWTIASASGGIQGYVPGLIRLDTSGVANALGGGAFNIGVQGGTDLVLSFLPASQNNAPTDIALSATTIAEANAINATIGTLTASDANAGDNHTYTLVAGAGDTDNASFNIAGHALRASVSLDFETKASYSVRVRATDAGGLFIEKSFTITVTDVTEVVTFDKTQITFFDGEIQVRLDGTPNLQWRIEGSSNLSSWEDLGTYTLSPDGTLNFTDPASATAPRRFYRAVLVP
jgi:autotransporter-associated beta strand protein